MNFEAFHAQEKFRVTRHFQPYTPEQRALHSASHRLGPRQREAFGEYFYTHPNVPNRAFPTRKAALIAAWNAEREEVTK